MKARHNPKHKPCDKVRPERGFYRQLSVIDINGPREVVTARWYTTGSIVRCAVWVTRHATAGALGIGSARGYGYDKAAAALADALHHAGYLLDAEPGTREALEAVATLEGWTPSMIVEAHA